MKYDIDDIEKLVKLMQQYGLNEIGLKNKDHEICLKFPNASNSMGAMFGAYPNMPNVNTALGYNNTAQNQQQQVAPLAAQSVESGVVSKKEGKMIRSPFVGTYYESSSPGSDAFVQVGQRVSKGDTLCIVEAMKIMNEIEADSDGVILEILAKNEDPVEFDQALFVIGK
ncbi:MAG: acetyl-CoA carboxylase biotin carboxyl carrier protein [Oligoflexales bacterium]|nr:acetyl-CoA carboxylase biotin carboxyl carrier protein [Oligoflexales bacterium]